MKETYYDILEVSPKASNEVIKKAYTVLVKKYHPDIMPENQKAWAEEKMKIINEAYETLVNPEKRSKYDEDLVASKNEELNSYVQKVNQVYTKNNVSNNQDSHQTKTYNDSYLNRKLRHLLAYILTLIIFIIVLLILWLIPYTHNIMIDFYNSNFVIKFIIDFMITIFKNIFGK